jgi:two-component system response regulator YesN
MFNVLIVEDEMLVSIGLKNMIDWAGFDMQIIAEMQNGKAALEIYHQLKPDLILTDIKMPIMDGLELISEIRKNDKKTKIIILTCYQEFDLVRQALKLGVSDYILKLKMSTEEMESVIKKVHDELLSENMVRKVTHEETLDVNLIKAKMIRNYVLDQTCSDEEFAGLVCKMGLRFSAAGLVLCIMKIDRYEQLHNKFDAQHENTIRQTILNLIDELLEKYKRGEIMHEKDERFLLLFSFGDIVSEQETQLLLYEILDRISIIMKTYINISVTFGVSRRVDQYSALHVLYKEAFSALKESYYTGDKKLVFYADKDNQSTYLSMLKKFHDYVAGIENLNCEYRKEIISGISTLGRMYNAPRVAVQELFIRWIHWPTVNSNMKGSDSSNIALAYAGRVRDCSRFDETIEVFEQYLLITIRCELSVRLVSK